MTCVKTHKVELLVSKYTQNDNFSQFDLKMNWTLIELIFFHFKKDAYLHGCIFKKYPSRPLPRKVKTVQDN